MQLGYSSRFIRAYRKLIAEDKQHVDEAIILFKKDPFAPSLRNHKLSGSKEGIRAISAGYDLRVLYEEIDGHAIVLFVTVGSHDDVYRG